MSGRPPGTVQGWARVGVTIAFVVVPFAGLAAASRLSPLPADGDRIR